MPGSIVIGDDITVSPRRALESIDRRTALRRAARTGIHWRLHQRHTVATPASHTAPATQGTIDDGRVASWAIDGARTDGASTWSITNAAAGCARAGPERH